MSKNDLCDKPIDTFSSKITPSTPAQPSVFIDLGAWLPENYGETSVILLPRDSRWLFSYWEITEQTARDIKAQHGDDIFTTSQAVVRMVRTKSGENGAINSVDVPVILETRSWYLNADQEGTSWFVELGLRTADGRFIRIAQSNRVTLPLSTVSNHSDEKWASVKENFEKVFMASGGGKLGTGSLDLARRLSQRWEMISQSDSGSWKGSGGISSFGGIPAPIANRRRGFWLVADCELILYGATEPSATLTIAGRPVELSPDGTFSLRFSLPDGDLQLPVRAISGDRMEEKEIRISVVRKTEKRD